MSEGKYNPVEVLQPGLISSEKVMTSPIDFANFIKYVLIGYNLSFEKQTCQNHVVVVTSIFIK